MGVRPTLLLVKALMFRDKKEFLLKSMLQLVAFLKIEGL